MLKSQLSTRGKKWHLGEITTKKKPREVQSVTSVFFLHPDACIKDTYAAAKRKNVQDIPSFPWGQSTVSSCLKEELFPNRWSGCSAFHLQGGMGQSAAPSCFLASLWWCFCFVFPPRAYYSWKPSIGASACWKMNCCWFSSTWGARVESSSTPK